MEVYQKIRNDRYLSVRLLTIPTIRALNRRIHYLLAFRRTTQRRLGPNICNRRMVAMFCPYHQRLLIFIRLSSRQHMTQVENHRLSKMALSFPRVSISRHFKPSSSYKHSCLRRTFSRRITQCQSIRPSNFLRDLPNRLMRIDSLRLRQYLRFLNDKQSRLRYPRTTPSSVNRAIRNKRIPRASVVRFNPFIRRNISPVIKRQVNCRQKRTTRGPLFVKVSQRTTLYNGPFCQHARQNSIMTITSVVTIRMRANFTTISFPVNSGHTSLFVP